ncbi:MAG: phytanoyl-CoA hydroxylase [Planctomycetota bacterium]|jgi:phytanoyl-CoA hydroxylase
MDRLYSSGLTTKAFAKDGFVQLRGFNDRDERDELVSRLEAFLKEQVPKLPEEHVFHEKKGERSTLKQVQQLGQHDSWFFKLANSGRFRQTAEQLLGGPVVPKNLQYFDKPPLVSRPTPAHQDGHYFMIEPCEAVTMWLAIDDADEENGCVHYVKGSHLLGLREHQRTSTLGFSQGISDYPTARDLENVTPLLARAGDLLVHDARTIHLASRNSSTTRSRRALGFIYYSAQAREDKRAHAAYQLRLASDLKAEGRL